MRRSLRSLRVVEELHGQEGEQELPDLLHVPDWIGAVATAVTFEV